MCVPPNSLQRVSIFLLPKCRAKRPLLLPFPAERKRKGPRGPSAFQFTKLFSWGSADATSFSLLDAKRTKQEKHAWGSVPHVPRARHFGSGQLRGTLGPVRRKGFKLTASRRFKQEAFSFPRCAGKFPHEPRRKILQALPWPSVRFLSRRKLSVLAICMEPFLAHRELLRIVLTPCFRRRKR